MEKGYGTISTDDRKGQEPAQHAKDEAARQGCLESGGTGTVTRGNHTWQEHNRAEFEIFAS